MGALLIPIIAVIVVGVVIAIAAKRWASARQAEADELADPAAPTLDYLVPNGQDPAVVLDALGAAGFAATVHPEMTELIHVSCPAGPERDRAHVRSVIASIHTTAIDSGAPYDAGDVRFTDER